MLHVFFLKLMTGSPLTQVSLFKCCVFTFYPFLEMFCKTVLYWMLWYLLFPLRQWKGYSQAAEGCRQMPSASCQPSTETAWAKERHWHDATPISCLQWLVHLGYKDTSPCQPTSQLQNLTYGFLKPPRNLQPTQFFPLSEDATFSYFP